MVEELNITNQIESTLNDYFSPSFLSVIDVSEKHKGHGGYKKGGGSHFEIKINSILLVGLSRIEAHRLINSILKNHWEAGIHSISINANN